MSARSTYIYNSDEKLRSVIDTMAAEMAAVVETTYEADSMSGAPHIPEALRNTLKFYLIHGSCILVKHEDQDTGTNSFSQLHPDFDDLKIVMEPTPTLTIAKYIPQLRKTESIVVGDTHFRIFRGGMTDIDFKGLLTFLGYSFTAV